MSYTPILATQTLREIEVAMRKDQGGLFRETLRDLMPQAEDAYRGAEDPFRSHLGASLMGRPCPRELWYSFHWTTRPTFEGQLLRLFNRGHLEEPRMVALLKMIGCTVWQFDAEGKQFRIDGHKGHFGGGLDSVILGLPDCPDEYTLGEFKTHNDKSFQKLKGDGMREAKFEHYVQMQLYMGKHKLRVGLYLAVNKNNDELYGELVPFDEKVCNQFQARAAAIIDAVTPPARISTSPGWYQCKFCDHSPVCHGAAQPDRNCRTCRWSEPGETSVWLCNNPQVPIEVLSKDVQIQGCAEYAVHPGIKAK